MMKTAKKPKKLKPEKNPAGMKLLRTLRGHTDVITGIAFSPDGKKIASGSYDNTIKIWETDSEKPIFTFEGHNGGVWYIDISPDGRKIVSGSGDATIKIWDIELKKNIATLKGYNSQSFSGAFSLDGKKIVSGFRDGTIRILDVTTRKNITTLEGHSRIRALSFSPDGRTFASGFENYTIKLWDVTTGKDVATLVGHTAEINSVSFSPDGRTFASASDDTTIRIWDVQAKKLLHVLEGHTRFVFSCLFSFDGQLLATKSQDNTIRLWSTSTWQTVAVIDEPDPSYTLVEMAFHPSKPILAAHGKDGRIINLWQLDYSILLDKDFVGDSVPYITAKIALVGDSGVGKTGLGWRIAHGSFKEHSSTHGQQFWVIDGLGKKRADGAECEAVLWDLAGQQDYRLVHALFLKDVDLALVLFDPGNREKPLSGVEYWLKQLSSEKQKDHLKVMLIGARSDRGKPTMTQAELDEFCDFHKIPGGYLATSAKEDVGIKTLIEKLKAMIPWDDMPATITTSTFKRVKEFVLDLKAQTDRKSVLVSPQQLGAQLQKIDKDWEFTNAEMMTAVKHLENFGYVTVCTGSDGKQSILLFPDILVNLASSFVLEARGNRQGLGVLEEKKLLAGEYKFADLKQIKNTDEREVLLDSAATLFLKQNICFRETLHGANKRSLLVFPSLINEKRPKTSELETEEDVSYQISGSVENVYASMVVLLGYTENFTRHHQWQNQAQYELQENQICGFRQLSEHEGEIELTLYYNKTTPSTGRRLFQGLFETFLEHREVKITRFETVICPKCKERQERVSVIRQIVKKRNFIHCSNDGFKIDIPESTELTPVVGVDPKTLSREKALVSRRSQFETALVRVKAILREREETEEVAEPSCFISYSWGVPAHEKWVLQLAKDLRNSDIDVLLDRWHNVPGESISKFISKIGVVDFALAVGTEKYREKYEAESTDPVVDMEIRMLETRLRKRTVIRKTVIPLLLEGTQTSAFPPLFEDSVYINFTDEKRYFVELFRLILRLYDIPFDYPGLDELIDSMKPKD